MNSLKGITDSLRIRSRKTRSLFFSREVVYTRVCSTHVCDRVSFHAFLSNMTRAAKEGRTFLPRGLVFNFWFIMITKSVC